MLAHYVQPVRHENSSCKQDNVNAMMYTFMIDLSDSLCQGAYERPLMHAITFLVCKRVRVSTDPNEDRGIYPAAVKKRLQQHNQKLVRQTEVRTGLIKNAAHTSPGGIVV